MAPFHVFAKPSKDDLARERDYWLNAYAVLAALIQPEVAEKCECPSCSRLRPALGPYREACRG